MDFPRRFLQIAAAYYPDVLLYLKGRTRWVALARGEYKTYDYFLSELERMIRNVYNNNLGGEFVDIMGNLLYGQFTQAFEQAWKDEEGQGGLPDYLIAARDELYDSQYAYVDQFYRDIVDARVDETGMDALLTRASLWANRWNEAYNQAVSLITAENGGNMIWQLGETEQHCQSCSALNGVVARAKEWDALGVHPQGGPNDLLSCGGWNCDCSLSPTDKRRSPDAYNSIITAVSK